eukprot:4193150-Prymnesium_polylepis.1
MSAGLLIAAGPASGKTSLMSQLVMHVLRLGGLVPVVVRLWELSATLQLPQNAARYASGWNHIEVFLQLTLGANSPTYLMLRGMLLARRCLLLLDGVDEAGAMKASIEEHISGVLLPQGHVLVVTSRPAALTDALYTSFERMELCPLTLDQQENVIQERLDAASLSKHAPLLLDYLHSDKLPRDSSGERITGNPLMLSMVISIFESSHRPAGLLDASDSDGPTMPKSTSELYALA